MDAMVIIKIAGLLLSVYMENNGVTRKNVPWFMYRKFQVTEIDLLLGYFASTLICAVFLKPNVTAYAIWTFYAITLGTFTVFRQFTRTHIDKLVMVLCGIIIAEIVTVCVLENFIWHFQVATIIAGILGAMVIGIIISLFKIG